MGFRLWGFRFSGLVSSLGFGVGVGWRYTKNGASRLGVLDELQCFDSHDFLQGASSASLDSSEIWSTCRGLNNYQY